MKMMMKIVSKCNDRGKANQPAGVRGDWFASPHLRTEWDGNIPITLLSDRLDNSSTIGREIDRARLLQCSAMKLIKVSQHVQVMVQNAYLHNGFLSGYCAHTTVIKASLFLPARSWMLQGVSGGLWYLFLPAQSVTYSHNLSGLACRLLSSWYL